MSVTTVIGMQLRPVGEAQLPYPQTLWTCGGSVVGDASGGTIAVEVDFKAGSLYSVEFVVFDCNALVDVMVVLTTQDGGAGFAYVATMQQVTATALGNATLGREVMRNPLIFRPDGLATANLQGQMANAAGRTLFMRAWGYIWDIEASRVGQGPLRPL